MSVDLSGLRRFNEVLSKTKENVKTNKKNPKIRRVIDIALEHEVYTIHCFESYADREREVKENV